MLEAVSLGFKALKEAVIAPKGLGGGGREEWLVGGVVVVGGVVLRLYSFFSSFCDCEVMEVGERVKCTWDANEIVKGVAVNARRWVCCLGKWVSEVMEKLDGMLENLDGLDHRKNNNNIGNTNNNTNTKFQEEFSSTIELLFQRLLRVLAHLHYCHQSHGSLFFFFLFLFWFLYFDFYYFFPKSIFLILTSTKKKKKQLEKFIWTIGYHSFILLFLIFVSITELKWIIKSFRL